MRYADGDEHDGEWRGGDRAGRGTHRFADGRAAVGTWQAGKPVGVAVLWSADRQQAWKHVDDVLQEALLPDEAHALAVQIGVPKETLHAIEQQVQNQR